jgi:cytochrome c
MSAEGPPRWTPARARTTTARGILLAAIAAAALAPAASVAAGDAARGAALFRACAACHSTLRGQHMTGPSLAQIWQRKAGTVAGFDRYSDAMRRADVVWTEATLDKWLADPQAFIPGTSMTFAGVPDRGNRRDLIAYLEAVARGKRTAPTEGGAGAKMGMSSAKVDLRNAPPQGQVTAIRHCRDTYAVTTADGKVERVWEFNLRFKTDSSALGPPPGKPVIVGAGMQGDRASVVFATPAEISAFVTESCAP